MVLCFVCHVHIENVEFYITHLTLIHNLKAYSRFECSVCPQVFQSKFAFKRHLLNKLGEVFNIFENVNSDANMSLSSTVNNDNDNVNMSIDDTRENDESINEVIENASSSDESNFDSDFDSEEVDTTKNSLKWSILQFILVLFGTMSLNRKIIIKILQFIKNLLILPLLEKIDMELRDHEDEICNKIRNILENYKDCLNLFQSEYKLQSYLKENDLYSDPIEFLIENSSSIANIAVLAKGVLLPLKENLKRFFELPKVLDRMLHYMQSFNVMNKIENICQGSIWKSVSEMYCGKTVIPYLLYQDDFELNNPLGSKSGVQKTSAFYLSLPLLPKDEISKLESIFVCYLNKSLNLEHGLSINYEKFCDILKDLEQNGIEININGDVKTVYFVLIAIIGDNLGINTVLGFTRSFQANFFCRFCKTHKDDAKTQTEENKSLLRNNENYWHDIFSDDLSSTGIRNESPFLALQYFKVTENAAVDIMHDFFEGICHVEITLILKNFILEKKLFNLEDLNIRKQNFQYHDHDLTNKSVDINLTHLNNQKLKMSASEMYCFIHYFPLMIYDFVDKCDNVWRFLLTLTDLVDACLKPSFSDTDLFDLESLIKRHHEEYLNIFDTILLPKHHIILHYPSVIKKLGPPRNLWAFRNEAKHKQSKLYANCTTSRKNIQKSIAIKWQYNFASFLFNYRINSDKEDMKKGQCIKFGELFQGKQIHCENFVYSESDDVYVQKNIHIVNTKYKIGDIITMNEDNELKFYIVINCAIIHGKIFLLTSPIGIEKFEYEIRSYIVSKIITEKIEILNENLIKYPPVKKITLSNQKVIIKPKPAFQ